MEYTIPFLRIHNIKITQYEYIKVSIFKKYICHSLNIFHLCLAINGPFQIIAFLNVVFLYKALLGKLSNIFKT